MLSVCLFNPPADWAIPLLWKRKGSPAGQVQVLHQIPQLRWTLIPSWRHSSNPQGSLHLCSPQNSKSNSEKGQWAVDWKTRLSWGMRKLQECRFLHLSALKIFLFSMIATLLYSSVSFCVCTFCFHSWSFLPQFFFQENNLPLLPIIILLSIYHVTPSFTPKPLVAIKSAHRLWRKGWQSLLFWPTFN